MSSVSAFDRDVIAVCPAQDLLKKQFLVTEYTRKKAFHRYINGNVIYNLNPRKGNVIDLALAYAGRFPKADVEWAEIGPDLLSAIVQIYPRHDFVIQPPVFANPLAWWDCPQKILEDDSDGLSDQTFFLHCYNEMWREAGVDKNKAVLQRGTLISKLLH